MYRAFLLGLPLGQRLGWQLACLPISPLCLVRVPVVFCPLPGAWQVLPLRIVFHISINSVVAGKSGEAPSAGHGHACLPTTKAVAAGTAAVISTARLLPTLPRMGQQRWSCRAQPRHTPLTPTICSSEHGLHRQLGLELSESLLTLCSMLSNSPLHAALCLACQASPRCSLPL